MSGHDRLAGVAATAHRAHPQTGFVGPTVRIPRPWYRLCSTVAAQRGALAANRSLPRGLLGLRQSLGNPMQLLQHPFDARRLHIGDADSGIERAVARLQ